MHSLKDNKLPIPNTENVDNTFYRQLLRVSFAENSVIFFTENIDIDGTVFNCFRRKFLFLE